MRHTYFACTTEPWVARATCADCTNCTDTSAEKRGRSCWYGNAPGRIALTLAAAPSARRAISRITTFTLSVIALCSGNAIAGGFALNEQNAKGLAQAFAGRSSMVGDASTVFTNPAGMTYLEEAELSGGFAMVMGSTDISDPQGTFPGSNDGDPVPDTVIPFAYYAQPIGDGWSAGIGIYVPFGLTTDYETGFQGRYFGTTSELAQFSVQPSLAYRLNEHWSLGFGVTYNWVEGELSRNQPSPIPNGPDIVSTVEGDDKASWGYNVGVLFEPVTGTRIGLSYRSEVDYELEGETDLTNVPVPGSPALNYNAALDITLPHIIDLSLTQRIDDRWTVYATIMRTGWASFDQLQVINSGGPTAVETQEWDDTWTYALGTSWQINRDWVIRAGVATDETPTNDRHRSVRVPSGDRVIFSFGGSWTPVEHITADFAYSYVTEDEITIDQNAPQGFSYRGEFETEIHIVAVQLNYRFP